MKKIISLLMVIVGFLIVFVSLIIDAKNVTAPLELFKHPSPLILVFGGTIAVGVGGLRGQSLGAAFKGIVRALIATEKFDIIQTFADVVSFAEVARRDGLLALEEASKGVEDPFLKRGLDLVIDGTDADLIAEVLDADSEALVERHKVSQGFLTSMGGYAPTLGIMGTVMGMMQVLNAINDPSSLGEKIAVAFLATLWGVGSANLIWLPLAAKLKSLTAAELGYRRMVVDGLLAIQSGGTPRLVAERMRSHLSVKQRLAAENARKGN